MNEYAEYLATRSASQLEELRDVLSRRFRAEERAHQYHLAAETSQQLFLVDRDLEVQS